MSNKHRTNSRLQLLSAAIRVAPRFFIGIALSVIGIVLAVGLSEYQWAYTVMLFAAAAFLSSGSHWR